MIPEVCINDCPAPSRLLPNLEVDVWAPSEDAEDTRCVLGMGILVKKRRT